MVGSVTLSISEGIGTIEFFHPKGNSLPGYLVTKLSKTIKEAGLNSEIQVIVLKSKGNGAFCAGASFDELLSITNPTEGKQFFSGFASIILAMKHCPKFVIVRAHGKAVGGGVGIIGAADYALASQNTSIKLSELTLGIGPFVIAPILKRKMGITAFSTLTINAKNWKDPNWALEHGLFNSVHETTKKLDAAVSNLSVQLSSYSSEAMEESKKMLWHGTDNLEDLLTERAEITGRLATSTFTKKFLSEFLPFDLD